MSSTGPWDKVTCWSTEAGIDSVKYSEIAKVNPRISGKEVLLIASPAALQESVFHIEHDWLTKSPQVTKCFYQEKSASVSFRDTVARAYFRGDSA